MCLSSLLKNKSEKEYNLNVCILQIDYFHLRLSTYLQLCNAGVMIARPRTQGRRPVINVNMFDCCSSARDRIRDENVIQLLGVLIEDVRIPLNRFDTGIFVHFGQKTAQ